MNKKYSKQCMNAMIDGTKVERDIKLSLSDNFKLKSITEKVRRTKSMQDLKFEEFVLLCKYNKINVRMYVTIPGYKITIIDSLLEFDKYTLVGTMYKVINAMGVTGEVEVDRRFVDLDDIRHYLRNTDTITFEKFIYWSKLLGFRIDIV